MTVVKNSRTGQVSPLHPIIPSYLDEIMNTGGKLGLTAKGEPGTLEHQQNMAALNNMWRATGSSSSTKPVDKTSLAVPQQSFGYKGTTVIPTTGVSERASEPLGITTKQGIDTIKTAQADAARMQSPENVATTATPTEKLSEKKQEVIKPSSVQEATFINPQTGREIKTKNITEEQRRALEKQGFALEKAQVDALSDLYANTELQKIQNGFTAAQKELENTAKELRSYMISDKELLQQTRSIESAWDARINDVKEINQRREQAIETLGIRMGSRWTGGSGGMWGGIVSAEERAGIRAIGDLEAKKQSAILEATTAARQNNWTVYTAQVNIAKEMYNNKAQQLATILEATQKQNDAIAKQKRQSSIDMAVGRLISEGTNDTFQILERINTSQNGDVAGVTAKEVDDAVKSLTGDNNTDLSKFSGDVRDFLMLRQQFPGMLPENIDNPFKYKQYMTQAGKALTAGVTTPKNASASSSVARGENDISGVLQNGFPKDFSISNREDVDKLPISDEAKAAMLGISDLKKITPTLSQKISAEFYRVGFNPKSYTINKINGLVRLWAAIPEEYKGVFDGFKTLYTAHDVPAVSTFNSSKTLLTAEITRMNEVGTLTDEDRNVYSSAMPSIHDNSLAVVLSKIAGVESALTGNVLENVGKTGVLSDGRAYIIGSDGDTLLDPNTGEPLE